MARKPKTNIRPLKVTDLDEVANIEQMINRVSLGDGKFRVSEAAYTREDFTRVVVQKNPPTQCYVGEIYLADKMNGLEYPWVFGATLIELHESKFRVVLFSVSPYGIEIRKVLTDFLLDKLHKDKQRSKLEVILRDNEGDYKNIFYLSGRGFTYRLVPKDGPDEWICEYTK